VAKITVVGPDDATPIGGITSASTQQVRYYFPGTEDTPALIEVNASPEKPSIPHAHYEHEIVYILEGSLILGRRVCGPGTAIHVPAETLYCFRVGPDGVRYLNFRPRADNSSISRDELMARRAERAAS
jgi:hypothetical protein